MQGQLGSGTSSGSQDTTTGSSSFNDALVVPELAEACITALTCHPLSGIKTLRFVSKGTREVLNSKIKGFTIKLGLNQGEYYPRLFEFMRTVALLRLEIVMAANSTTGVDAGEAYRQRLGNMHTFAVHCVWDKLDWEALSCHVKRWRIPEAFYLNSDFQGLPQDSQCNLSALSLMLPFEPTKYHRSCMKRGCQKSQMLDVCCLHQIMQLRLDLAL